MVVVRSKYHQQTKPPQLPYQRDHPSSSTLGRPENLHRFSFSNSVPICTNLKMLFSKNPAALFMGALMATTAMGELTKTVR